MRLRVYADTYYYEAMFTHAVGRWCLLLWWQVVFCDRAITALWSDDSEGLLGVYNGVFCVDYRLGGYEQRIIMTTWAVSMVSRLAAPGLLLCWTAFLYS